MVAGALTNLNGAYLGTLPVTPNNKNQLSTRLAIYDAMAGESGSVTVYGTVGDGVTDDRAAIQSAIDAAVTLGCGLVLLPAGSYYVGNCLNIGGNRITFCGQGKGVTKIIGKAGAYAGVTSNGNTLAATIGAVGRNHVTIRDLTIDNQTNGTSANGIAFVPATSYTGTVCTDVEVINCEVLGYVTHEYLIWSFRSQRVTVSGCTVDGYASAYTEDENGIEIYGGYDVRVTGNKVKRCAGAGISVISATPVYDDTEADGVLIEFNQIASCKWGVLLDPVYDATLGAQSATDIIIRSNIIKTCNAVGVYMLDEYATTDMTGVTIEGNQISGTPQGISCDVTQTKSGVSKALRIVGNTIRGATHASLGAIYVTKVPNCTIAHNEIYDTTYDGIRLTTTNGVRVIGNRIITAGRRGIQADAITDGVFHDNYTDATTGAGLYLASSPVRCVVTNNHIKNVPSGTVAMFCESGSYCAVNDNDFYRASSSGNELVHSGTNKTTLRNVALGAGVGAFVEA